MSGMANMFKKMKPQYWQWGAAILIVALFGSFAWYALGVRTTTPWQPQSITFDPAQAKKVDASDPIIGVWEENDKMSVNKFEADGSFWLGTPAMGEMTKLATFSRADDKHIYITNKSKVQKDKSTSQLLRFEIDATGKRAIIQYGDAPERLFERRDSSFVPGTNTKLNTPSSKPSRP